MQASFFSFVQSLIYFFMSFLHFKEKLSSKEISLYCGIFFVSILTAYMSDRILICVFIISSLQLFGALFCFYRAISVQFSPKSSLISIYRLEVFERRSYNKSGKCKISWSGG